MRAKRLQTIATGIAFGLTMVSSVVWAQLPPTNMGKFVHQPGDNQYNQQTQRQRHPVRMVQQPSPVVRASVNDNNNTDYQVTKVKRPDISIEPIVADEPIAPAGFPPIPDRLELPINTVWAGPQGGSAQRQYAQRDPNYGNGPSGYQGSHQRYAHYEPGAFKQQDGSSHGYYKARTPNQDYYNTGPDGAASSSTPSYNGASTADLRRLGKEPKLNEKADSATMPAPPTPVVINQAKTQDLSLPEDDYAYHRPSKPSAGKQMGRQVGRALRRGIRRARSMAPGGF